MKASSLEPTFSVVIPTLNEAATIGRVLDRISVLGTSETLVIDGGSQDSTIKIVHDKGVKIVQQTSRGWDNAVCEGIQIAKNTIVVIIEANGTCNAQEIPTLLKPFTRDHNVGLVVGSRIIRSQACHVKVNYSVYDVLVVKLISFLYNMRYGLSIDPTSKFFALKKDLLTRREYENLNLSKHLLLQLAVRLIQKARARKISLILNHAGEPLRL
ncbi:MAG: glycosyltransferase family 2 protein [Candidatus Kariarchaeaceae archaeon]|jgi:glycosyltransferase involved in cell wall biosynthesis